MRSVLDQARSDVVAECGEEGEDHSPADEEVVGTIDEIVDDAELVRDLGTAEDDGERRGGIVEQPIADLDLGPDERAGVVRQEAGDVVDRGLLAVDDAESVGDEVIGQLGQLTGEVLALGSSFDVSPGLKRRFSSSSTSPSSSSAAFVCASSPTVSAAKATSRSDGRGEFGDDRQPGRTADPVLPSDGPGATSR
jgi:hypothetical protein